MEINLRRLRDRIEMRFVSLTRGCKELLAAWKAPDKGFGSQRICPFCGLITPRAKRSCLECGKSLRGVPVARKGLPQE